MECLWLTGRSLLGSVRRVERVWFEVWSETSEEGGRRVAPCKMGESGGIVLSPFLLGPVTLTLGWYSGTQHTEQQQFFTIRRSHSSVPVRCAAPPQISRTITPTLVGLAVGSFDV